MPRNASGVFSFTSSSFNPAVSGTVIASAAWNTLREEIVTDLNAARPVTAGGTGATNASAARTNLGLGDLAVLDTVAAAQIDADAVTTAKILDANVTTAKIADDAVDADKLAASAVVFASLASGALASQAEAEAGTATDKLLTPERVSQAISALGLSGGSSSLGTNGYITFGGLILQWGIVTSIAGSSATNVTFPTAFPSACFTVVCSMVDRSTDVTSDFSPHARSRTTTGFRAVNGDIGSTIDVAWIALGN